RATARIAGREAELRGQLAELERRADELDDTQRDQQSKRDRASGLERDVERRLAEARAALEDRAGVTAEALREQLVAGWIEEARAEAAALVRNADQSAADPAHDREARRAMEIAAGRYQNHFLTERNISNIRIEPAVAEVLVADDGSVHHAIEQVANVQLLLAEDHGAVRLDGLDGVGREVARRALAKLAKKPQAAAEARNQPQEFATKIRTQLEQEIRTLGKKAFQVLEVPRAHPEIVELVGALNYRTSYTQNQWLHAVEASFLAGMMAAELGLDEKLARRATLMHDIGKALTHKIEGSHAVIGADIARRLGEPELVANAIGAHHADEPPNSVYAYLVAAADAMSGARPGARREATEGFSTKVEDLERIGRSYRGVLDAHAVHGGRELRVYVRERDVDDVRVVELSSEIAERVSEELTFPGQIKVTVIRAYEAIATAS
ncbi:MAG: HDIG domain-containing protein, partial [Kofleriaceae bacterium]|nr:HDIG domain-containing protein [Kofleriaceae bacterium]